MPVGAWISHPDSEISSAHAQGLAAPRLRPNEGLIAGLCTGPEHAVLVGAIDDFCDSAASPYNPLVLHGPPGVGKSTVARSVVARFAESRPADRFVELCAVEFAREYAAAVSARRVSAWRDSVRGAALLVVEDLSAITDKIAAQNELIHTLDAVRGAGGQILVTLRQPVCALPRLLPGLASRLAGGLCLAVPLPHAATRLAILRKLAAARSLRLSAGAGRLLAERLVVAAPELSGALNDLAARAHGAPGGEIDATLARAYLQARSEGGATLSAVARRAARHFALKVADLRGPSRRQAVVTARNLAMHAARQLTGESFGAIGTYFGGRDHTTVMHGCARANALMESDPQIRQAMAQVRADLGA